MSSIKDKVEEKLEIPSLETADKFFKHEEHKLKRKEVAIRSKELENAKSTQDNNF